MTAVSQFIVMCMKVFVTCSVGVFHGILSIKLKKTDIIDNYKLKWCTNPKNVMRFGNTCVFVVEISWNTQDEDFSKLGQRMKLSEISFWL